MKLVVSSLADGDLEDIARYSERNWGLEQARRYADQLIAKFGELAANPALGKLLPRVPIRFRCLKCRSHYIFFTVGRDQVTIMRVLHESMDFARHLP